MAGLLAALLLLGGCGFPKAEKEEPPIPEEYQQTATVIFES